MPGSKSIRIFVGWFSLDSNSQNKEIEICESMSVNIIKGDWDWNSDKTCFWIGQRSFYYTHKCNSCKKEFNYPVEVSKCPVCSSKIENIHKKYIGRIETATEKDWNNPGEIDPRLFAEARKDLRENSKEEGFDWQHLKDNL